MEPTITISKPSHEVIGFATGCNFMVTILQHYTAGGTHIFTTFYANEDIALDAAKNGVTDAEMVTMVNIHTGEEIYKRT